MRAIKAFLSSYPISINWLFTFGDNSWFYPQKAYWYHYQMYSNTSNFTTVIIPSIKIIALAGKTIKNIGRWSCNWSVLISINNKISYFEAKIIKNTPPITSNFVVYLERPIIYWIFEELSNYFLIGKSKIYWLLSSCLESFRVKSISCDPFR